MNSSPTFHSPTVPSSFEWVGRLAEATTPREVADLIVHLAEAADGFRTANVFWDLTLGGEPDHEGEPITQWSEGDLELAHLAALRGLRVTSSDGCRAAIPLSESSVSRANPALLVVAMETPSAIQCFLDSRTPFLTVAGSHLHRALEATQLKIALAGLERSELLQRSLFAISDLAGSDCEMPELLRGIHAIIGTLMYAENFIIVLHDARRDTIRFLYYADVEDTAPPDENLEIPMRSLQDSLTWHLLREGKPLMGNTEQLQAQVSGPLVIIGPHSRDLIGVPMLRDGRVRGAIVVQSYHEVVGYSADDQMLLQFVASHVLIALIRRQGKEDLEQRVRLRTIELADANQALQQEIVERQRAERLQAALYNIAQLATTEISEADFYPRVHAEVGDLINAENFFIALLSEDGQMLEFPYAVDESDETFRARRVGNGLSEYVLRRGGAIFRTEDMLALADQGEIDLGTAGALAACWLGAPLLIGDTVIGLVAVQSYRATVAYGPTDQSLLSFVASQIANTLHRRRAAESLQQAYAKLEQRVQERTRELREEIGERERIQQQLKHEVMHDALTGLPNRGYLLDRLTRALARLKREPERRAALLYLDVDRFKVINDGLGHLAGDEVLKEVARRLLTCVREPDIVARLSGDEFAILLEDVTAPAIAVKVAQRVLVALGAPLQVAGKVLEPSASIGIALVDKRYGLADAALKDADVALYRAKQLGRKRFELFDEALQTNAVNVLAMEGELSMALQRDQFEPYFQPIVRLGTGEVVGYEALIRWNHPTRGVLCPADFLRIAEDNGSIEAIDWRMFELSCGLATRLEHDRAFLTINVSPLHLRRADFDVRLQELLRRTGLPCERLIIEVTEGSLLDNSERVCGVLERLRAVGVGAALDDFGTGYSSLSYLHRFPLKMLKIDRSFVAELGTGAQNASSKVVAAVLTLAHALGIEVIAEGIETNAQRNALMTMGCEFGQGYLFGRPAPIQPSDN